MMKPTSHSGMRHRAVGLLLAGTLALMMGSLSPVLAQSPYGLIQPPKSDGEPKSSVVPKPEKPLGEPPLADPPKPIPPPKPVEPIPPAPKVVADEPGPAPNAGDG